LPSPSSQLYVPKLYLLCSIFTVLLIHFFPHTTFALPSSQLCAPTLNLLCSIFTVLLISILPSQYTSISIQSAVCTHTLSALFHFYSAPYFTSSPTQHLPSPSSQLFLPTIYLLCSIFTVLLIHFFLHTTLALSIQSAVCTHT
jgi:hypothetical protein